MLNAFKDLANMCAGITRPSPNQATAAVYYALTPNQICVMRTLGIIHDLKSLQVLKTINVKTNQMKVKSSFGWLYRHVLPVSF